MCLNAVDTSETEVRSLILLGQNFNYAKSW
ncbi:hypothetical protein V6Z11_D02G166200 [Gossypium hirsutum]